jgi:hypothetical protein
MTKGESLIMGSHLFDPFQTRLFVFLVTNVLFPSGKAFRYHACRKPDFRKMKSKTHWKITLNTSQKIKKPGTQELGAEIQFGQITSL